MKSKLSRNFVDEGLARFRYAFPDDSVHHLNMFLLRTDYTRRLMFEVCFKNIQTFGDFQETYPDEDPNFYIHVAEKAYLSDER